MFENLAFLKVELFSFSLSLSLLLFHCAENKSNAKTKISVLIFFCLFETKAADIFIFSWEKLTEAQLEAVAAAQLATVKTKTIGTETTERVWT